MMPHVYLDPHLGSHSSNYSHRCYHPHHRTSRGNPHQRNHGLAPHPPTAQKEQQFYTDEFIITLNALKL